MAPTPSTKRRSIAAINAEVQNLQTQLADLHSKRLHALRLYQSEKTLRQAESARADHLSQQLSELSQQRRDALPLNKLRTEHFDAHLRSMARIPSPSPMVSLTWHCLSMADTAMSAPEVLATLQPTTPQPTYGNLTPHQTAPASKASEKSTPHQAAPASKASEKSTPHQRAPASKASPSEFIFAAGTETRANLTNIEAIYSLCEELSALTPQVSMLSLNPRIAVDQLKSKLNESNSTCAHLLATVKQQQQTIKSLSR